MMNDTGPATEMKATHLFIECYFVVLLGFSIITYMEVSIFSS